MKKKKTENNMKNLLQQIEKPILEKRTGIGKAFDEMFKQSFPIHYWCQKNKKK